MIFIHRPLEDEGAYSDNDDDFSKSFDGSKQEMTEERRAKLREIEVWERIDRGKPKNCCRYVVRNFD